MEPARRLATYDDLVLVDERMTAELIDGELVTSPRPASRHGRVHRAILRALGSADEDDDDPPGWRILPEPECHLGHPNPRTLVLVPDLAGWHADRDPDLLERVAIELTPDWVCEILSPGNARHDRLVKMDRYARCGVSWAWIVDPLERTLEVYQLHSGAWLRVQTASDEEVIAAEPFGIELRLRRWWTRKPTTV
jgi:Uma2 family endonuclease